MRGRARGSVPDAAQAPERFGFVRIPLHNLTVLIEVLYGSGPEQCPDCLTWRLLTASWEQRQMQGLLLSKS